MPNPCPTCMHGWSLQRSADTSQVLSDLCDWLVQLCMANRGWGFAGRKACSPPTPRSYSVWGWCVSSSPNPPPHPIRTKENWNSIAFACTEPKNSKFDKVTAPLIQLQIFFKASSKRQMFGLIKNRGGNLQLHQGIIYWTNILVKNMKRSARPCKVFCFKKIFIKPLFYGFNKQNPLPHGIFCWPHTRENKMVIQGNAFDFYCG